MSRIGVVVIGRNEGERLRRCLSSLCGRVEAVVYVDSGSTDGSVELARSIGARVLELDSSRPFNAARARNEGFEELVSRHPTLEYVQFVDGDCEVREGWLEQAAAYLDVNESVAIVFGRRRERFVEASIYNRLCDIEWRGTPGPCHTCGGDSMMRVCVYVAVGGFDPAVIAGEEPELSLRVRRLGYEVVRLDREMVWHDSAMLRFGQWWRRMVRSGHAYAQGMALHGRAPERHYVRRSLGIWVLSLGPILAAVVLAWPTSGASFAILGLYALQVLRTAWTRDIPDDTRSEVWLYAVACTLGKWPQLVGQSVYLWRRIRGWTPRIIEYKGPEAEQDAEASRTIARARPAGERLAEAQSPRAATTSVPKTRTVEPSVS